MAINIRYSEIPPAWLVDWIREASGHDQYHSLVLDATRTVDLNRVSSAIADYLNEYDGDCSSQWRIFDDDLLRTLAGDPACRNIVLAGDSEEESRLAPRPDLDRIVRRLARLGGVIIIGPRGLEATRDLRRTFHVCLCENDPPAHRNFHMWVNPERFSPETLVSVIADSFLDWSCQAVTSTRHHSDSHPGRPNQRPDYLA